MVFDNCQRTDTNFKKNRESEFDFLNRSARPEIARVRNLLESCVFDYPHSEQKEIVDRIKCGDDTQFKSTTFELLLHAALKKLGCVLVPHPKLENNSKKEPDFLVTTSDGFAFYLEAVLASEKSTSAGKGAVARKGIVMDTLSSINHQNFMVDIDEEGFPETQPSSKALIKQLLNWLDSLNPDDVKNIIDNKGFDAIPSYLWQYENWSITFRPIPLKPERRGKSRTLVGVCGGEASWINSSSPIKNAIKFKGNKYGEFNLPYLVAVNVDSPALDRIDEMEALYGQEQYLFSVVQPENEPEFQRMPNGAWIGKSGPQYTRVSGSWIFRNLTPYTVATGHSSIYFNPWASKILPDFLKKFPHAVLEESKVKWNEGLSLREIFELNDDWPE